MSTTDETFDQPEVTDVGRFEDEEIFSNDVGEENTEEAKFDEMIGVLQDILIDPQFVDLQSDFCRNNCGKVRASVLSRAPEDCNLTVVWGAVSRIEIFENVAENKLIYTDIFRQYTTLIGTWLAPSEEALADYDEIPLDVIDVLLSCSDFEEFKSLMISFKQNETPCIEITGDALVCCGE
ncbi:hypothetical protein BBJ28_00003757 [Nothophytophthora sp. Chile5]|nr:hypothetical protein BBJ28_00003757 [Nothophytophthora sp. Chile5]